METIDKLNTTKPGAWAPGVCLLSSGAVPRGGGRSYAFDFWLDESVISCGRDLLLQAKSMAHAPARIFIDLFAGRLTTCYSRMPSC